MPKLLEEEHPQLFHYTSAAGLDGIIRSQTLYATHYAYLNDAAEIRLFLENRLPQIFQSVIMKHSEYEEKIDSLRGIQLAKSYSEKLLNSTVVNGPLAEPYIASFCTPKYKDDLVDKHGLLSQWRGYGKDGGYALVFDTAGLSELLKEMGHNYENSFELFAGDIVYSSDDDQRFSNEFLTDLNTIESFLSNELQRKEDDESLSLIFIAIMRCACRYKHWGFREENEVRIILIPTSNEVCEIAKADGVTINEIPRKQYLRSGSSIPFVELFEGVTSSTKPLPIRRVIVGPCPDQERAKRVRAVEILLSQHGIAATVSASEIPYVG